MGWISGKQKAFAKLGRDASMALATAGFSAIGSRIVTNSGFQPLMASVKVVAEELHMAICPQPAFADKTPVPKKQAISHHVRARRSVLANYIVKNTAWATKGQSSSASDPAYKDKMFVITEENQVLCFEKLMTLIRTFEDLKIEELKDGNYLSATGGDTLAVARAENARRRSMTASAVRSRLHRAKPGNINKDRERKRDWRKSPENRAREAQKARERRAAKKRREEGNSNA